MSIIYTLLIELIMLRDNIYKLSSTDCLRKTEIEQILNYLCTA